MMVRPASIEELREIVPARARIRVRGGGTKPALSRARADETTIDLSGLAGVTEHTPDECTFTALSGTRVADVERLLTGHGQYLPFDPPLVDAGATLGGTVAAGVNGSSRYRYGGIRDFLIGAHVVNGRGGLIRCGGKVVKNAAGFLLHQGLVGSCGRFGVIADLTFKVFPRPPARATIVARAADLGDALAAMRSALKTRLDLEAIDIDESNVLLIRVSGLAEALPSRVASIQAALHTPSEVLRDAAETALWQVAREYAWAPAGSAVVRVPTTLPRVRELDAELAGTGAIRRYALAGNLALIAWPGDIATLSQRLGALGFRGQVLIGTAAQPFIGAVAANEFERRVRSVMDPDGRFAE
jgi:glycolate oxidase FAD binding subunit